MWLMLQKSSTKLPVVPENFHITIQQAFAGTGMEVVVVSEAITAVTNTSAGCVPYPFSNTIIDLIF